MMYLSLFVLANVWVFSSSQQACSPVQQNVDPSQLPKINTQFQARIEIFSSELKNVVETLVKYDADNEVAQVVYRDQNATYSESYFYAQNEVFLRINGECVVKKLTETFGNQFFGALVDQFGNVMIKPPTDFLFWNNGVPHRKLDPTVYRGIPVNHYQSCQTFTSPGLPSSSFLVDYYFKTVEFSSPIDLPGFESYREIPLGFTARGVEVGSNQPFNREYYFYEFKNYLEYRQDITNEREGEFCAGQTWKMPVPDLPKDFSFVYQTSVQNIASTAKLYYSYDWKVAREDMDLPSIGINEPTKVIHDFYSGVDYIINKIRNNCTVMNLGSYTDSILNAAKRDNKHYLVMKTPEELFDIDDSYFFAGNRYERGIKSNVYVTKKVLNPELNASLPSNQAITELYFAKIQEANYEGVDQLEVVWPIAMRLYQHGLPEPVVINVFDFDSKLKRHNFDISKCFAEKDIIRYALRFSYPEGLSERTFEREFGRQLEEAFDEAVLKAINVYNVSPLRIIPPTFTAYDRYIMVESGFTHHAHSIYQFSKSQKRKTKSKGETIVSDSPEDCAHACIYKDMYANSPDPKCYGFDFVTTSSGTRCILYPFTYYNNPNPEVEEEIVDHYDKIVETIDSASEKQLYASVQEAVTRREFVIKIKDSTGTELIFIANEVVEVIPDENGNIGGTSSFFERFVFLAKDTDLDPEEVKKRETLILRERTGVSIDECARLCVGEAAFMCEIMTYGKANRECKWTSLPSIYDIKDEDTKDLFMPLETYDVFERDPFFNYIKYPYMVTGILGLSSIEVRDERECALKCNSAKDIHCRSFNFCEGSNKKLFCILSELNVHNEGERDPQLVDSSLCNHYSKFALADYELMTGKTLDLKPQTVVARDNVEGCAELCSFEDQYLCRSFEFVLATSTCRFYRENLVDQGLVKFNVLDDPGVNHYSRQYYVKDGVLKKVEPTSFKSSASYGAGTVIGIIIVVTIGGILFGIMSTFVYFKVTRKSNLLPVMKFSNPNYHEQKNDE